MALRDMCWSENSWRVYKSRWSIFCRFCEDFDLEALPASVETVGLYIAYLARDKKYSTVSNYVSTIWVVHDYFGVDHPAPSEFLIRSALRGAKRLIGDQTRQVDPLMPEDLVRMRAVLDLSKAVDF